MKSAWKRTGMCADYGDKNIGQSVTLMGWVQRSRNLGSLIFVWLRDISGIIQLVFDQNNCSAECFEMGESLRGEYVIAIKGVINKRAEDAINPALATGMIEISVTEGILLNRAKTPPIYIEDDVDESESVRLKYRYLDLRRPSNQRTLLIRSKINAAIRHSMEEQNFTEIETPILTKSTPEGARDFLVPYRGKAGQFYALPQSPQIYKQLLMLAGFDKYYQLARCFRDEDNRADRQPEFTQLDLEMTFVQPEDVQTVVENVFKRVFKDILGYDLPLPLPRMTWRHAMDKYGSDKPDIRFDLPLADITPAVTDCGFSVFEKAASSGKSVRALRVPGGADKFSRKEIDALGELVKTYHAKGLAWATFTPDGGVKSSFMKFLSQEAAEKLLAAANVSPGDALFIIADKETVACTALGQLRLQIGKKLELIDNTKHGLLWITEFPLFEYNDETEAYDPQHHPFTSPMDEDFNLMESDLGAVRAKAYDLVFNGIEMGSGSIRIHDSKLQSKMFSMIGLSAEQAQEKFGFLLEAFQYGTPPHGGFAFGIDRLVMQLLDKESLRDVLAFPKVQNGSCLMMATPSEVDAEQLELLHIKIHE